MAIIEEIEDEESPIASPSPSKATREWNDVLVEEIEDDDERARPPPPCVEPTETAAPVSRTPPPPPPPPPSGKPASSPEELVRVLGILSAQLALPEDLLPSYLSESTEDTYAPYRSTAEDLITRIAQGTQDPLWPSVSVSDQSLILDQVVRLKGKPEDKWTSETIAHQVDDIASRSKSSDIAVHLLTTTLRSLFAAHPSLSNARALPRPAGGREALDDAQEYQPWKTSTAGWGAANAVRWAASVLPDPELVKHLGALLPPTLTLMDDWEPRWRDTGAWVLSVWISHVPSDELRRRGLDTLLLASLTHSLGMHSPPMRYTLQPALVLVRGMQDGAKRADAYAKIVDAALVTGWSYINSSERDALVVVAEMTVVLARELGTGITRWLKSIIPALLEPLQHPPVPAALAHYAANLRALGAVLDAVQGTGRAARWRGQILDVGARCWVQVGERMWSGGDEKADKVRQLLKDLFGKVEAAYPAVREGEFSHLLAVNKEVFAPLVAAA